MLETTLKRMQDLLGVSPVKEVLSTVLETSRGRTATMLRVGSLGLN